MPSRGAFRSSIDDDLYYVPSKKKEEKVEKKKTPAADAVVVKTNAPTTVYASPGNTTIVVKDRKGIFVMWTSTTVGMTPRTMNSRRRMIRLHR